MAVTRSSAADRAARRPASTGPRLLWTPRPVETLGLALASLVVLYGLWRVWTAKSAEAVQANATAVVNVNRVDRQEQLLPALMQFQAPADRQFVAARILQAVRQGPLANVGALSRLRVSAREIDSARGLTVLRDRLQQARSRQPEGEVTIPLLTVSQVTALKPFVVVRTWAEYRKPFLGWAALTLAAFYAIHLLWILRGFRGDRLMLPAIHLLAGMGLVLMASLRDPLRDTLSFVPFAQGVVLGAALLAATSFANVPRLAGGLSWLPLLAALALSALLVLFGSGPGTSDAKVNLGPVQPIEAIRILLVLFLAGYFRRYGERLRELRERGAALGGLAKRFEIPRLELLLPVLAAVGLALLFFFVQKDLGPALVFACLFLALYAVARQRLPLALAGVGLMVLAFALAYQVGYPRTVTDRVQMWLSPWDNLARGGDQLAHSLWALGAGGPWGAGIGRGEPATVPAGHTDLVLSTLGEEWGFVGLLLVFGLYGLLLWRSLRIAERARSDYPFYLALGLTLATALQIGLIAGGAFGLVPLSGVVTPFLSYGRSSMLANFVLFGILLALSAEAAPTPERGDYGRPLRFVRWGCALAGLLLVGRLAFVQVAKADAILGAGTLIVQGDGARRYQYNPRLMTIAASISRGSIYDRNGLPLATSRPEEISRHRQAYAALGRPPQTDGARGGRQYPLGPPLFHLLGDVRTRANWGASNSSLAERDSMVRLQGYDDRATAVEVRDPRTGGTAYTIRYDYRELVPLWRHHNDPTHPAVRRVMERQRDLRMSIDGRLQMRAATILAEGLRKLGRQRGALVVLDPVTGDLLASVSHPWPQETSQEGAPDAQGAFLDRARYGLYPPGSSFKIVTALAALRLDPRLAQESFPCVRLPDGRVGNVVKGSSRPIRDDVQDRVPHGDVQMEKGTVVSCNAYYAQLGTLRVGAPALHETARKLGISTATPDTPEQLRRSLPQASYGQGQVVASPFQMARVAATVAAGGQMPFGRWVLDESNTRTQPAERLLAAELAAQVGRHMRGVVTAGTGRRLAGLPVAVAGKTGTAELEGAPSHAWFIGFAPADAPPEQRIAFAVVVENGQYGGTAAAPIAGEVVLAARQLGLLSPEKPQR